MYTTKWISNFIFKQFIYAFFRTHPSSYIRRNWFELFPCFEIVKNLCTKADCNKLLSNGREHIASQTWPWDRNPAHRPLICGFTHPLKATHFLNRQPQTWGDHRRIPVANLHRCMEYNRELTKFCDQQKSIYRSHAESILKMLILRLVFKILIIKRILNFSILFCRTFFWPTV